MRNKISLIDSTLLGVGGMIGGGVFILNGVIVKKNRNLGPFSWLIGFLVCITVVFSYVLLSQEYPSNQGTIEYPRKLLTRNKFIISGIIIVFGYVALSAVYSLSLGEYVANYFNRPYLTRYIAILTIIFCQIINYFPQNTFVKIEDISVFFKIFIFLFLIVVGLYLPSDQNKSGIQNIKNKQVDFINTFPNIIILGFASFLSYEGFEMISNESKMIKNPKKNLPYSYFLSILIVFCIYFGITFVTNKHIGNEINEQNKFSSLINLTYKYGFTKIGPSLIIILCIIANITAINATIFTNKLIFSKYLENFNQNSNIVKSLNYQLKVPFFEEKRKIILWIVSLIAICMIFLPIIITTNLGSLSFLIIFLIISYLGLKMIKIKEKKKIKIKILDKNIPYQIGKIITILAMLFCILGSILLIRDSYIFFKNY